MKTYGIRISDSKNNVLNVRLSDIIVEISKSNVLNWCILFLDGTPNYGEEKFVSEYKNKINKSKNGLKVTWNEVDLLDAKFRQIFEVIILGCKLEEFLQRYDNDQKMYQSCDIVIELIDCAFWQVFSNNQELINKLKTKFIDVELLEPDFEK